MKNFKLQAIFVTIILILFTVIVCLTLDDSLKNIVNYISIVGTTLSILGLYYAFLQILSIKQSNYSAIEAVKSSISRINQVLSVSDLSKTIKSIEEIQNYIKSEDVNLALLRMTDIKNIIVGMKYNLNLVEQTSHDDYQLLITTFHIDQSNLHKFTVEKEKKPNYVKIIHNLENLSTKLIEFENILKSKG